MWRSEIYHAAAAVRNTAEHHPVFWSARNQEPRPYLCHGQVASDPTHDISWAPPAESLAPGLITRASAQHQQLIWLLARHMSVQILPAQPEALSGGIQLCSCSAACVVTVMIPIRAAGNSGRLRRTTLLHLPPTDSPRIILDAGFPLSVQEPPGQCRQTVPTGVHPARPHHAHATADTFLEHPFACGSACCSSQGRPMQPKDRACTGTSSAPQDPTSEAPAPMPSGQPLLPATAPDYTDIRHQLPAPRAGCRPPESCGGPARMQAPASACDTLIRRPPSGWRPRSSPGSGSAPPRTSPAAQ